MLVKRDAFAREELHRIKYKATIVVTNGCSWCGGIKREKHSQTPYLFQYHTESDGGRFNIIKGLFCSNGCMKSYHN